MQTPWKPTSIGLLTAAGSLLVLSAYFFVRVAIIGVRILMPSAPSSPCGQAGSTHRGLRHGLHRASAVRFQGCFERIAMETAHCGEASGKAFAVACFQLFNEHLDVGGNNFFQGLRLGAAGRGWTLLGVVICEYRFSSGLGCGCFTVTPWPRPTPAGAASASSRIPFRVGAGVFCPGLHKRSAEDKGGSYARQGRSPSERPGSLL